MQQKSKNIILILGFVFIVVLCYQFAISNTISARRDYLSLRAQKELNMNSIKQLAILKKKQSYFDSILRNYKIKGSSIQNSLLETINAYSNKHNLTVMQFLEPHLFAQSNLTTTTYLIEVRGSYNNITGLVHKLEQKTKFGEVINVHLEKIKNHKTGAYYLKAKILLSNKFS